MVYVVIAAYEFYASVLMTELIGVFNSQLRAFHALEDTDFMKVFEEEMTVKPAAGSVLKEFGQTDGYSWYSETHYVKQESDGEAAGSVTFWIFERLVE